MKYKLWITNVFDRVGEEKHRITELQREETVQYLLNVCDKISWKISTMVVKNSIHPAFLQTIFRNDFDHVAFLEVKKSGFGRHMIVQSPYILHFL